MTAGTKVLGTTAAAILLIVAAAWPPSQTTAGLTDAPVPKQMPMHDADDLRVREFQSQFALLRRKANETPGGIDGTLDDVQNPKPPAAEPVVKYVYVTQKKSAAVGGGDGRYSGPVGVFGGRWAPFKRIAARRAARGRSGIPIIRRLRCRR